MRGLGLQLGLFGFTALTLLWGWRLGVRPLLAYGIAQSAVLALLWLYPRLLRSKLRVTRTLTGAACEEDELEVRFELENHSRLWLLTPELIDLFRPDQVVRRRCFAFPALPGRAGAELSYTGTCFGRRGIYAIGPLELRLSDPLGIFACSSFKPEDVRLTVYPALEVLGEVELGSAGHAPAFGGRTRREAGEGDVPLAVREYRPGDPLRRIHWPTSARRGRLSIVEYERQLARRVTILIDLSRASLRGLGRQATLEVAIRTAGSLAQALLERGDRVGLEGWKSAGALSLSPAAGRAQLCRILEALALLKPDGTRPLSEILRELLPTQVRGQALVLVVADVEEDGPRLLDSLTELSARRCQVLVVLLDPATFPRIFDADAAAPAMSLYELAEACTARGVRVHVLGANAPLAPALQTQVHGRPQLRITPESLAGEPS